MKPNPREKSGSKLVVGLGNPEAKYLHTRHNLGFMVLDKLARDLGVQFTGKSQLQAELAEAKTDNGKLLLVKPQTFMNASGQAVQTVRNFYKISNADLLVVHDDIDLPLGSWRLSKNSGSAGHRGIESILQAIGQDFPRLRLGIENRSVPRQPETEVYVLQNFTPEETQILETVILPAAVAEIQKFLQNKTPPINRGV